MSVGFPIDVTRLLGDNQRFQRDLSLAHQLQHQLRVQLDQTLAANQALRMQCEQLERQKQSHFNSFISTHQELYENQIATLRIEREELIRKIKENDKAHPDLILEQTIQHLSQEIQRHEIEKNTMENDLSTVKELMNRQQEQIHKKLNQEIQQKQLRIKELQSINIDLKDSQEELKNELNRVNIQKIILQENGIKQKRQLQSLEANWKIVADKTSVEILTELIQIRNQNISLKGQLNQNQISAFSNDQDAYSLLKKLHEELAVLRYENTEAKNANSQVEVAFQNQRTQFRNEKAQQQLLIIKLQKELAFMKDQDRQAKFKLQKVQDKLKSQVEGAILNEKVEEEIALLKIKVFVLESLRNSQKYRKSEDVDYDRFEAQFQAFGAFKLKSSRIDVLKNVASMHVAMAQTIQKLRQEQTKKRETYRKAKQYKSKWEAVSKRQAEALRMLQRCRQKELEYQKLIEKMQEEFQKAFNVNVEVNQRHNINILISSYQEKLKIANNEVFALQNHLRGYEQNIDTQKRAQEKEINKLNIEIKQLEQSYNQILQKNRSLENKILQQALSAATSKVNKNYQSQLAQKTAALIMTEQQLQGLREQLSNQRQSNQQQASTISHFQEQITRLKRQLASPAAYHYQINFLQQKLAYLQGVLGQQRNANNNSNDNHIRTLYEQIAILKTETQESKHEYFDRSDRSNAQSQIQSYRIRLIQLEEALRGIANENEEKSLEIFRLNQQNNLLSKQLDKIQEELDLLRGKAGSMREIDLIDRNKQLEDETDLVRRQLARTVDLLHLRQTEMEALRKQCQQYWSDNLKLLVVIKQNNIQLKENKFLSAKYDQEVSNRQQQLQTKIESLSNQNQILKNLVQDLRKSILQRQSAKLQDQSSKKSDIQQLKKQIQAKQRQNFYFQQQLHRLLEERMKEKDTFDQEWNKLVSELNDLRQQLHQQQVRNASKQHINTETFDEDSRIKVLMPQNNEDEVNLMNLRAMIAKLQIGISQKNEKIQQLQSEVRNFQLSLKRSGIYSEEVIDLRNQMQKLLEGKFVLQDKIRNLEQQNSLLKIRRISQDIDAHQQVFSQQTFGPSIGTNQLIEQLKSSEEIPAESATSSIGELKSWNSRYEEVLCLLVISFAEIESLRNENADLGQRCSRYQSQYTQKLRHIEESLKSQQSIQFDVNLLHELQCGHRHLIEMTHLGLKEGTIGLAQLGSFTESITGGKMIESYSVREEDESLISQEMIHM